MSPIVYMTGGFSCGKLSCIALSPTWNDSIFFGYFGSLQRNGMEMQRIGGDLGSIPSDDVPPYTADQSTIDKNQKGMDLGSGSGIY